MTRLQSLLSVLFLTGIISWVPCVHAAEDGAYQTANPKYKGQGTQKKIGSDVSRRINSFSSALQQSEPGGAVTTEPDSPPPPVREEARGDAEVAALNNQIQNIIRMNDSIKNAQTSKIAQLQQIQEQARIHQQILQNLETAKTTSPVLSKNDIAEVLRQEKVRIIREQTSRNQEIVKKLTSSRRS